MSRSSSARQLLESTNAAWLNFSNALEAASSALALVASALDAGGVTDRSFPFVDVDCVRSNIGWEVNNVLLVAIILALYHARVLYETCVSLKWSSWWHFQAASLRRCVGQKGGRYVPPIPEAR